MALHPPLAHPAPPTAPRGAQHRAARAAARSSLLVVLVAALGIGVLLYPSAATWFSARAHDAEVTGYVQDVQHLPLPEKEAELERARHYNSLLPGVPLGDPYAAGDGVDVTATGVADYLSELDVTPVMARVRAPEIDVDLPVYHGTDTTTLSRGIGHLFGSSLPVGGRGTHAVLTGHSGLVNAKYFDALHDLSLGDTFTISVLDEVLTYRVDQILVVEPGDIDELQIVPGKDYVTLITCTPIGVNSHRLFVRGERIETPDLGVDGQGTVPGTGETAGFPWWALGLLVVPAGFVVATRTRRHTARSTTGRGDAGRTGRDAPRRRSRQGGAQCDTPATSLGQRGSGIGSARRNHGRGARHVRRH